MSTDTQVQVKVLSKVKTRISVFTGLAGLRYAEVTNQGSRHGPPTPRRTLRDDVAAAVSSVGKTTGCEETTGLM